MDGRQTNFYSMKRLFPCLFLLLSFEGFAQQQTIFLHDGSALYGEIVRVDSASGQTVVRLSDQTEIALPTSLIAAASRSRHDFFRFENGEKLLKKGRYTSLAFHTLAAKTNQDFVEKTRWNMGGHVALGYQFNQFLAIGGGVGLDAHEDMLMPVFGELRGFLTYAKNFDLSNLPENGGYRFPLTYGLQFGYNLPVESHFSKNENLKLKGGLLFYPSIGLLFPTRGGASLRFDFGYKIQRFQREQPDWWGNYITDKVTMRSLALRMGVIF